MSVKLWDVEMGQMVQSFDHHQEFVVGLDFSLFDAGLVASGSWDRTVCVWNHEIGPPMPAPIGFAQPAPRKGVADAIVQQKMGGPAPMGGPPIMGGKGEIMVSKSGGGGPPGSKGGKPAAGPGPAPAKGIPGVVNTGGGGKGGTTT